MADSKRFRIPLEDGCDVITSAKNIITFEDNNYKAILNDIEGKKLVGEIIFNFKDIEKFFMYILPIDFCVS